jgi:riboflavin synthase
MKQQRCINPLNKNRMFTGLISAIGTITTITKNGDTYHMHIAVTADNLPRSIGDSIAVNGICLTVTATDVSSFTVTLSAETLRCTSAKDWTEGTSVNLEPALAAGDRLGGHFVSGHVDGLAEITAITPAGECSIWQFRAPQSLAHYLAVKGSVTLDGISLTVNEVQGCLFRVMIIPHTLTHTTLSQRKVGEFVNIEVDMIARYVERLMTARDLTEKRA